MAKRYCMNCGREIEEGTKFCPYCGKPVLGEDTDQISVSSSDSDNTDNQPTDVYQRTEDTQYNQTQDSYNTADYTNPYSTDPYGSDNSYHTDDSYDEEEQVGYGNEHEHIIIPIIIIIVAVLVFCGIMFGKNINGFLYDHAGFQIPFMEQADKPDDKEKAEIVSTPKPTETAEATPVPTETPEPTETPVPVTTAKTGTVYINASAKIQDINVRNSPSTGSGTDTGKNVYPGDKVTIYETTQSGGYTWYRIGDNEWIADNGSSFGVKLN